jgi:AcrR family transcriptional regulator
MAAPARAYATRFAHRTIKKFLDAAEEVFGQHGYEGTTIRAIAGKARVNLGTLQHYWGSKRELFRELFERRFRPLMKEHLRRLQALDAATSEGRPPPDGMALLRTLIEPTFFVGLDSDSAYGADIVGEPGRKRFHALFGRALMDPSPHVIAEMTKIFDEPMKLLIVLMRRTCPNVSAAEIDWRVNCVLGALVFSQVYSERVGQYFGDEANVDDARASSWILHFLVNGANAPPYVEANAISLKAAPALRKKRKRPGRAAV